MSALPNRSKVAKLWKGETVFILGGGPSLLDEDISPIHDRCIIGVNDAFKLGDWVDISWSTDCRWLKWNKEALKNFTGVIYSAPPCRCINHHRVVLIARKNMNGICQDPSTVYWNKNSGASAINLAYHLGASRIVLLGFDMKMRGENHNWHTNHQHTPRPTIYEELFLGQFIKIAADAKQLGLEIINSTVDSALTIFPHVPLKEVLNGEGD